LTAAEIAETVGRLNDFDATVDLSKFASYTQDSIQLAWNHQT